MDLGLYLGTAGRHSCVVRLDGSLINLKLAKSSNTELERSFM